MVTFRRINAIYPKKYIKSFNTIGKKTKQFFNIKQNTFYIKLPLKSKELTLENLKIISRE
jgi:hypothetical protein